MLVLPNNFIELLWSKRMKQMTLKHGAKVDGNTNNGTAALKEEGI